MAKKATKAFHPDLPDKDAWFDPLNLEKELLKKEDEGRTGETKAGIPSELFEVL